MSVHKTSRDELIQKVAGAIRADLERQSDDRYDGAYLASDDPDDAVLIDGVVNLHEAARAALAVFEEAHAKELDTSPERVKKTAGTLHVTPSDDEEVSGQQEEQRHGDRGADHEEQQPDDGAAAGRLTVSGAHAKSMAHAPTDNEREALVKRLEDEIEYHVRTAVALPKGGHAHNEQVVEGRASVRQIAAGFRRSEVPEPTAEEAQALEAVRGWTQSSGPGVRVLRVLLAMAERAVSRGGSDDAKR